MKAKSPWTWEDSACTSYLRKDAMHFEALQASGWHPKRLLMLGCGDGTSLNETARRNPNCAFVGLDMNPAYIEKAESDAPENVLYVTGYFHDLPEVWYGSFDTVLMVGVIGCISEEAAISAFLTSKDALSKDGRLMFNFPNKMIFGERMVYRDATVNCTSKEAALRTVDLIAKHHPSETVQRYGRLIMNNSYNDQEHFLFAPDFVPYHEWEIPEILGRCGFDLIHSRTSPFALEQKVGIVEHVKETITSESRWHTYGRKSVHDNRE